jgi:hypothetical protein
MKVKEFDKKGNPIWVPDNYQEVKEDTEIKTKPKSKPKTKK